MHDLLNKPLCIHLISVRWCATHLVGPGARQGAVLPPARASGVAARARVALARPPPKGGGGDRWTAQRQCGISTATTSCQGGYSSPQDMLGPGGGAAAKDPATAVSGKGATTSGQQQCACPWAKNTRSSALMTQAVCTVTLLSLWNGMGRDDLIVLDSSLLLPWGER